MRPRERQLQIIDLVRHNGKLGVDELAAQLEAMQAQMLDMQKEIKTLRAREAASPQVEVVETDYGELKEEVMVLREDVDDLDDRLMEPEKHAAIDRITWGGEFRFQAHGIKSQIPDYVDGMQMQTGRALP